VGSNEQVDREIWRLAHDPEGTTGTVVRRIRQFDARGQRNLARGLSAIVTDLLDGSPATDAGEALAEPLPRLDPLSVRCNCGVPPKLVEAADLREAYWSWRRTAERSDLSHDAFADSWTTSRRTLARHVRECLGYDGTLKRFLRERD
jgi:hypothetical protein